MQIAHAVDQVDEQAHLEEPVELNFLVVDYFKQTSSAALGCARLETIRNWSRQQRLTNVPIVLPNEATVLDLRYVIQRNNHVWPIETLEIGKEDQQ